MTEPILDPIAFAHLIEITGDDLEFVDELVDTYLDDAHTQLEAMRAAAASGDVEALVRPVHSLKSSSANVGAAALAETCRQLEADARGGAVPDPAARVTECADAFAAAHDALLAERAAR
jgi:HPt (histidine-containing phosphotransfer) domain-containing protein